MAGEPTAAQATVHSKGAIITAGLCERRLAQVFLSTDERVSSETQERGVWTSLGWWEIWFERRFIDVW